MNKKDQVVNLQLSKKLKELGVEQESLFYWRNEDGPTIAHGNEWSDIICSAFTVAELYQLHYEKFGTISSIPVEIHPEELANWLAEQLIANLTEI